MNWSALTTALVPPLGVTTLMSTVPLPAGDTAVMLVAEFTVKLVAAVLPKLTAVVPVKLAPVMATEVPPVVGPLAGAMVSTAGP